MPLGSSKIGLTKNKQIGVGGGSGSPAASLSFEISYTGNTNVSVEANAVVFGVRSNFANTTMNYEITGNIAGGDFTDATLTGNVTTDSNGNANITKTIVSTTGNGHKDFVMNLKRPSDSLTLLTSAQQNIYEVLPIVASGGDTSNTYSTPAGTHNVHKFTTPGNANLSLTSLGNYTGNVNVWNEFYQVSNANSYFRSDKVGLKFRSLIVGAAPSRANVVDQGAGELGVLEYALTDIAVGTYTMQTGERPANASPSLSDETKVFVGTSLQKTALPGGGTFSSAGDKGGSGSKDSKANISFQETDLAQNVANVSQPGNFKTYVTFASGSEGSLGANSIASAGGGAFGFGGSNIAGTNNTSNDYGFAVSSGGLTSSGGGMGGPGIRFSNSIDTFGLPANLDYTKGYYNPIYGDSLTDFCGGGGDNGGRAYVDNRGASQQFLIVINGEGNTGQLSYGGGGTEWSMANVAGQSEYGPYNTSADAANALSNGPRFVRQESGIATLSYPNSNTRFVSGTIIT